MIVEELGGLLILSIAQDGAGREGQRAWKFCDRVRGRLVSVVGGIAKLARNRSRSPSPS
jgi:hypothetical protein